MLLQHFAVGTISCQKHSTVCLPAPSGCHLLPSTKQTWGCCSPSAQQRANRAAFLTAATAPGAAIAGSTKEAEREDSNAFRCASAGCCSTEPKWVLLSSILARESMVSQAGAGEEGNYSCSGVSQSMVGVLFLLFFFFFKP